MRTVLAFLFIGLVNVNAFAHDVNYIDSVIMEDVFNISKNTFISSKSFIESESVNILRSVVIENQGVISSNIFISDSCTLEIRNSGYMTGDIHIGNQSRLIQIIKTPEDMTRLYFTDGSLTISVQSQKSLNLSDILSMSNNIDKIVLNNASVAIGQSHPRPLSLVMAPKSPNIELIGEVTLEIGDLKSSNGKMLLSNVSGDGIINILGRGLDPLYVGAAIRDQHGNVYLKIQRETDYHKVLHDARGDFINNLRLSSPNNKTIMAMDNAITMADLNSVMSRSAILNPINLMRPIKTFENFEINSFKSVNRESYFDIEPIYIISNGMDLYGAIASVNIPVDDLNLKLSVYSGSFETDNNLDEFSGIMYGGNVTANIDMKSVWMHSTLGFTVSMFKTDGIFNDGNIEYNPTGVSIYGVSDIGTKFDFINDFYVSPFIGIGGDYGTVLNQSDESVFARAGGIFGFGYTNIGIKYDYQFFASLQTNNVQSLGAKINFLSIADYVGGGISYSVNHDDFGLGHKISAELKFIF